MLQPEEMLQQTILGCLLSWPEEIDNVAAIIKTDDFHGEKYRLVFDYLLQNQGGDFPTVVTALNGKVPAAELATWIGHDALATFLPRYCKDLKEIANKRRLFDILGNIRLMAAEHSTQDMLDKLESHLSAMAGNPANEPMDAKALMFDARQRLKKRYDNKNALHGIPYGIAALDAATNGLHQGELIVVAGRPSMGKSALAGNILENVCREGKAGILFSLEMDQGNCADRMIASAGNIHYSAIRSGRMFDADWPRATRAFNEIHGYRLFIDDTPAISLREIKAKCRKLKKGGLDVVVVDYLQLMGMNPAISNRVQAIGEVSRGLKQMARELECAVVLLSQLNRGVDSRNDKRPNMSDLRDSGEIEQDADVILFPFRPAAYCAECKDRITTPTHDPDTHKHIAEIIIEKQRNGERNISVPVAWMGEHQRFQEL